MGRLTHRYDGQRNAFYKREQGDSYVDISPNFIKMSEIQGVLNCLSTYEDADEQCLLVWLPCKVGDTVYVIRREAKTGKKSIHRGEVINFMLGEDTVVMVVEYDCCGFEQGYFKWGCNAFATNEEAEAALKED